MLYPVALWKSQVLPHQGFLEWKSGPLSLFIKRTDDGDWLWAAQNGEESLDAYLGKPTNIPDSLNWTRWAFSPEVEQFRVVPSLLDKSVVVRPQFPLMVPPGSHVRFFVSIPLIFRIAVETKVGECLLEPVSSLALNTVWFGDLSEGELCYGLLTRAVRDASELQLFPHRAICPVVLHNNTSAPIPFNKICIKVRHLTLYQGPDRLWTNTINIVMQKSGTAGESTFECTPPGNLGSAPLLAEPLEHPPTGAFNGGLDVAHFKGQVKAFLS